LYECLQGLLEVSRKKQEVPASDFKKWIHSIFGKGVAKYFMLPYNKKVWATPLETMSQDWIAERVSVIDFERVLKNVILEQDDINWGPNNTFKFPLNGGTGEIFRQTAKRFEDHIGYGQEIQWIDADTKKVGMNSGQIRNYDWLISTMPLDVLISKITDKPEQIAKASEKLHANKGLVVGLGFNRPDPSKKCWVYFPEDTSPCYRATYFSNYSPHNVPDSDHQFSLMGEISFPKGQCVDTDLAIEKTIQGYIDTGLIEAKDRKNIQSVHTIDIDYSYPVPTLERDKALAIIQPWLESKHIYSRGRFGAWKYEVANMDHSAVQGMEIIDKLLLGHDETMC
jgi:protoporphyrinogen oxidase